MTSCKLEIFLLLKLVTYLPPSYPMFMIPLGVFIGSQGFTSINLKTVNNLFTGDLVGDFIFDSGENANSRVLHCRNAPSPGATSSLAIGRMMADKMEEQFHFPRKGNAVLY